jgi:hypothetical protein
MMAQRAVERQAVGVLVLIGAMIACIRIGGTQERRLVDLNDGTLALRLRVAQEYATSAQLEQLRSIAKARFPNLTERDLATLGLGWQDITLGDGEHVMLVVTFMPESKGVDAKAVADYVAQHVLQDVGPKLKGGGGLRS